MAPMAGHSVSSLDASIVCVYVLAVIVAGVLLTRKKATASDYFLAHKDARWPIIGLSLVASNISPTALIGITGSAYAIGMSVYNYEWMAAVVLFVFSVFFLPNILQSKVFTIPEFLERRYGKPLRIWFAGLCLALTVLLDTAGVLYGGALLLHMLVPTVSLLAGAALFAILGGVYALTGGLRAVMYTEAVQGIIVLVTACILSTLAIHASGGLQELLASVPRDHLSLLRPASDAFMPWTGLITGAPILGFYFWCTNQYMVQRMLAAHTISDGQKGAVFAGFLKLLVLFAIVFPGVAAIHLYPGLEHGDEAYLSLLFGLMPHGLIGVALAAFCGALMAQLSAGYSGAATLISMDFIRLCKPDMPDRELVKWGRVATGGCIVLSMIWVPQIANFPSLWQYMQAVMAYATPPAVALVIIGSLWQGANERGALCAVIVGNFAGVALFAAWIAGFSHLQFLHVAGILFMISALALVVASGWKRSSPQPDRLAPLVIGPFGHLWQQVATPVKFGGYALFSAIGFILWIFR